MTVLDKIPGHRPSDERAKFNASEQPRRLAQRDAYGGDRRTIETVEATYENGDVLIKGMRVKRAGEAPVVKAPGFAAAGTFATPQVMAETVLVVWKGAKPILAYRHEVQKAKFSDDELVLTGVLEELLILGDQIWFRNDKQFTLLRYKNKPLEFPTPPLGVRWGLDRSAFHVVMADHVYQTYRIKRDPAKVLGVTPPVVTPLARIPLETRLETILASFFRYSITETELYTIKWQVFPDNNDIQNLTEYETQRTLVTTREGTFSLKPEHFLNLSGPDVGEFKSDESGPLVMRAIVTDAIVNADGHLLVCLSILPVRAPGTAVTTAVPFSWMRLGEPGETAPVGPFTIEGATTTTAFSASPAAEHHGIFLNASTSKILWSTLPPSYTATRPGLMRTVDGPGHNAFNTFDPAIVAVDPGFEDPGDPGDYYRIGIAGLAVASPIMFMHAPATVPPHAPDFFLIADTFGDGADPGTGLGWEEVIYEQVTKLGYTFFDPARTPFTPLALTVLTAAINGTRFQFGEWFADPESRGYRRTSRNSAAQYAATYQVRILRLLRWHKAPAKQRLLAVVTASLVDEPFAGASDRPERLWVYVLDGEGRVIHAPIANRGVFDDWNFTLHSLTPRHAIIEVNCTASDVLITEKDFLYLIDLETGRQVTVAEDVEDGGGLEDPANLELKVLWPRFVYAARENKRRYLARAFDKATHVPTLVIPPTSDPGDPLVGQNDRLYPAEDKGLMTLKGLKNLPATSATPAPSFLMEKRNRWVAWMDIVHANLSVPSAGDPGAYQIYEWQQMAPYDLQLITDAMMWAPTGRLPRGPAYDSFVPRTG